MRRHEAKGVAVPAVDAARHGVADAYRFLQHGFKDRLKIAGRAADNLQHLRCSRLLLQRLGEFARALLLRLKQADVLDRNYSLVGEGFDQLYLLLGERPNRSAVQEKNTNGCPLA